MYTLTEVAEKLAEQFDETTICELLQITPQDLVIRFEDRIETHYSKLAREIE